MNPRVCTVNVLPSREDPNRSNVYDFYITMAVRAWLQDVPNYGLKFYERTNSGFKSFHSAEKAGLGPELRVTYTTTEAAVPIGEGVTGGTVYRLRNKKNGAYLTSGGNYDEANVYATGYNGSISQQWLLTCVDNTNGFVTLAPLNAPTRRLDVYGRHTTNETNIQMCIATSGVNQQWKMIRNWDGSYRIVSRMIGSRGVVWDESGTNVHLYDISKPTVKNDYWTLEPVNKGRADFYTFKHLHDNRWYDISTQERINEALALTRVMGYSVYNRINQTSKEAYDNMRDNAFWVYSGHGDYGALQFASDEFLYSYLGAYGVNSSEYQYINTLWTNSLSGQFMTAYYACTAGALQDKKTWEDSLVGRTFKRGSHFVFGPTNYLFLGNLDSTNKAGPGWLVTYLTSLRQGKTVLAALTDADNYLYANCNDIVAYGDYNQRHELGDYDLVLYH